MPGVIEVAAGLPWQNVVDAVTLIRTAGLTTVQLAQNAAPK
jgi:hypothetical protein